MAEAYIYDALRTPRGKGKQGGALNQATPIHLAATALRALAERNKAQREAQLAAESAYDLALQRFRAGLTGYLTVLATETEVLQERRAGVLLAARAYQLDVDLKRALGGGFDGTAFPAPSP